MPTKSGTTRPLFEMPAGVQAEVAVQFGHDLYGLPFIRIIKRTRRSTSDIAMLVAKNRLFNPAEIESLVTAVGVEVVRELEITSGVQLALPTE